MEYLAMYTSFSIRTAEYTLVTGGDTERYKTAADLFSDVDALLARSETHMGALVYPDLSLLIQIFFYLLMLAHRSQRHQAIRFFASVGSVSLYYSSIMNQGKSASARNNGRVREVWGIQSQRLDATRVLRSETTGRRHHPHDWSQPQNKHKVTRHNQSR
jgi:hypothetical protein